MSGIEPRSRGEWGWWWVNKNSTECAADFSCTLHAAWPSWLWLVRSVQCSAAGCEWALTACLILRTNFSVLAFPALTWGREGEANREARAPEDDERSQSLRAHSPREVAELFFAAENLS